MTDLDLERANKFIADVYWKNAKSYEKTAPHEYCVKDKIQAHNKHDFEWLCEQIKLHGKDERFFRVYFRYLTIGNHKYWTMEKPGETPILINRTTV